MNPRVIQVLPDEDYTILIKFANGEIRRFDTKPYLDKGIFQQLREPQFFNTVKPFLGSVQWVGEQDFDPDMLYEDSIPINETEIADKLADFNKLPEESFSIQELEHETII